MARNGRMVRGFYRGNGWFSRFYAIEEITLMIVRTVQFDLVFFLGNLLEPIQIRGIKVSSINPHPTISADPFCTHLNIVVASGDCHNHFFWILAGDSVLAAGVPNCVARRELTGSLNFRWAPFVVA